VPSAFLFSFPLLFFPYLILLSTPIRAKSLLLLTFLALVSRLWVSKEIYTYFLRSRSKREIARCLRGEYGRSGEVRTQSWGRDVWVGPIVIPQHPHLTDQTLVKTAISFLNIACAFRYFQELRKLELSRRTSDGSCRSKLERYLEDVPRSLLGLSFV
jgi:hypothetical protein